MKRKLIVLPAVCLFVATGVLFAANSRAEAPAPAGESVAAAEAQPAKEYESFGDTQIINMEPVKAMFSHKSHVVTAGLSCDSCHPDLFERKRGAAKAKGDLNHTAMDAGMYCGACHDGKDAFATTNAKSCKTCHGSDMKQPGVIVFNKPVKGVVFDHKGHVDMGLSCSSCHDSAFEMRMGAAEEEYKKFNMQALYQGKYCGVCHNGNIAFASNTRCTSCHIGVKGVARMQTADQAAEQQEHK